jgi:hypothetical protein
MTEGALGGAAICDDIGILAATMSEAGASMA